jgi:hypothetical protein
MGNSDGVGSERPLESGLAKSWSRFRDGLSDDLGNGSARPMSRTAFPGSTFETRSTFVCWVRQRAGTEQDQSRGASKKSGWGGKDEERG